MIIFWDTFKKGSGIILQGVFVASPATLEGQANQSKIKSTQQIENTLIGQSVSGMLQEETIENKLVGQFSQAKLTES